MAVTQKKIAEYLGVSRQLVGLALQGKGTIADETRKKVIEAANTLGYDLQSNREARVLISQRYRKFVPNGMLALLSPRLRDTEKGQSVLRGMPFFHPYFEGAEEEAMRHNIDLCLCLYRETGLPRLIRTRGVDGVVCIGLPEVVTKLHALNLPTVALGFYSPDTVSLLPEDQEGVWKATQQLLRAGHTQIAHLTFVNGGNLSIARDRQRGYEQAMEEGGLSKCIQIISAEVMTQEAAATAVLTAIHGNTPLTALVCYNDYMAMGVIQGLRGQGIAIPEQISVIGFDDVTEEHDPALPLASVRFDRKAMGCRAVQILSEEGRNGILTPRIERFPAETILRETTRRQV